MNTLPSERYEKGLKVLDAISAASGRAMVDNMRKVAPALADWAVEFGYGDVVSRPGLDLRTRQLATVAALTALGTAAPQLRAHLNGALNVGCTPVEIIEVIQQMAVFAGFPAAINGVAAAREVFEARGIVFDPASVA
jgi:4-carboxymuconolactone decarboxylase